MNTLFIVAIAIVLFVVAAFLFTNPLKEVPEDKQCDYPSCRQWDGHLGACFVTGPDDLTHRPYYGKYKGSKP